jgi:hypothetical protein
MRRLALTGLVLALVLAAPAAAGTWSSLAPPQASWDNPFALQYDTAGNVYAETAATAGATSVFVRPPGGAFGAAITPILGSGPIATMTPSDNSGRVHFLAGRGGNVKYRRRGLGGNLAPMPGEANLGAGALPNAGVNGSLGHLIAVWPATSSGGALAVDFAAASNFTFAADTLTGAPTAASLGSAPFEGVAVDGDGSGVIVYTDADNSDGALSYIVRPNGTTPQTWSTPVALGDDSTTSAVAFAADLSGDALVTWRDGGGANHTVFRAHDASTFGADDPLPAGAVTSLALQPDGSALAVVASSSQATLYRRAAGGSGWTALSGPHPILDAPAVDGNAVVAASRTADRIAFAWAQTPAPLDSDHAYRVFAQVGTATDIGAASPLPDQPASPGLGAGNNNHNELPGLAVDKDGNALAVWRAHRSSSDPAGGLVAAAVFDPSEATVPGGGGNTAPPSTGPPAGAPVQESVEALLGLSPPRGLTVSGGALRLSLSCVPSNPGRCHGAVGTVIAGSYNSSAGASAARLRRFTYRVPYVYFTLERGQRTTVRIRLTRPASRAVAAALSHRGGKAVAKVRAIIRAQRSRLFVISLKR